MPDSILVYSDMDGTLLDHHGYAFEAALPMMKRLEQAGVPVILNTSKTLAELRAWIQKLGNRHPFIVENGSAIYIPHDYFPDESVLPEDAKPSESGDYRVITTGRAISTLRAFKQAQGPEAIDLTECSLETAMAITGLDESQARQAQDRQYSLPLQFSDPEQEQAFSALALQKGFGILRGGRFLHLMGATDKGSSLLRLKQIYQRVYDQAFRAIALGDSPNDLAMLEQAEVAVVVNSPSSEKLQLVRKDLIRTRSTAPEGWVEGVERALESLSIRL